MKQLNLDVLEKRKVKLNMILLNVFTYGFINIILFKYTRGWFKDRLEKAIVAIALNFYFSGAVKI